MLIVFLLDQIFHFGQFVFEGLDACVDFEIGIGQVIVLVQLKLNRISFDQFLDYLADLEVRGEHLERVNRGGEEQIHQDLNYKLLFIKHTMLLASIIIDNCYFARKSPAGELLLFIFIINILKQMNEENHERDDRQKRRKSFMRSLPKAIQVFQLLQHQMKSIYPFQMITKSHKNMNFQQEPYRQPLDKPSSCEKFKPILETVMMHFQKKNVIYDKFNNNSDEELFNENIFSIQRLKNLKNVDYMANVQFTQSYVKNSQTLLSFDSRFESGNLSMVSYLQGVYYLLLQNDVNTSGYTSWFYFSVKNKSKGRYRFAILNYGKAGWMHNQGVKICVYNGKFGWQRGCQNISCQANRNMFSKGKFLKFNTLYFQYEFSQNNSEIFFSYNVPYTYNDLCCLLDKIEQKKLPYFNRKLAGTSLAGNRLQILTITDFQKLNGGIDLPVIVFMARAHPGETVSSWIMHEFINFVISNSQEAVNLRKNFVFKLFPMINPDGVIHGNYRCSLSGRDLNRRWNETNKELFSQVYFIRNQIIDISKKRQIKMILDLHGHTQKKSIFAYGCNDRNEPHRCRLFPYIVSKLTSFFEFKFCNFFMDKSKRGTARLSLYNQLRIPYTYTIQTSQFGTFEGHLSRKVFSEVTQSLAQSFTILFKVKNNKSELKNCSYDPQQYQKQLLNDSALMKIGADKDSGSDSEPSVDDIKYDRLIKLNNRKAMKVDSTSIRFSEKFKNHRTDTSASLQRIPKRQPVSRPQSTEMRTKRIPLPEQQKIVSQLQRRKSNMSSRLSTGKKQRSEKLKIPQNQQFASRSQPPLAKRRMEVVSFINLSLSIYDDSKSTRSYRIGSTIHHPKYRGLNEELFNKLNLAPATYSQFRRIK